MESLHEFVVFQFALVKPGIKVLNRREKEGERRREEEKEGEKRQRKGRERTEEGGVNKKGIIEILTRICQASFPYRGRVEDVR